MCLNLRQPTKNYSEIFIHLIPLPTSEPLDHREIREKSVNAARALLKTDGVLQYFKEEELTKEISSLVYEVLKSPETDRENLLRNELAKLIERLGSQVGNWRIVVPLDNLTIAKKRRLHIGDVTFSQFTRSRMRGTLAKIRAYLLQNPHYMNKPKFISEYIQARRDHDVGKLVGTTCAEIVIFGRAEKAYEEALPKIEEAIAGIKLCRYPNDDFYGRYFGIRGSVITSTLRQMLMYPKGPGFVGARSEIAGTLHEVELDTERIKFMQNNGLPELSKILKQPNPNELEKRIVSSVLWFGKATDIILSGRKEEESILEIAVRKKPSKSTQAEMMNPYDRLLKLIVSFETLLIFDPSEPIQSNLAERVAFIVAKDYPSRRSVVKFMKQMYGYRSSIVHHGGKGHSQSGPSETDVFDSIRDSANSKDSTETEIDLR